MLDAAEARDLRYVFCCYFLNFAVCSPAFTTYTPLASADMLTVSPRHASQWSTLLPPAS